MSESPVALAGRKSEIGENPSTPLLARKELLTVADLRREYGFGRDLSSQLIRLLPHIKVGAAGCGDRLLVRRDDIDQLCRASSKSGTSLWHIVREFSPTSLTVWLKEFSR